MLEAVNLAFEEKGFVYTMEDTQFEYDLESFFDFYKVINAKALSERIGMNQSLLSNTSKELKKTVCTSNKIYPSKCSANRKGTIGGKFFALGFNSYWQSFLRVTFPFPRFH